MAKFVIRLIVVYSCLAAIIFISFDIRVKTWKKEEQKWGNDFIYTLESALLLRYARLAVDNKVPVYDKKIEFPDGIKSFDTFSLSGNIFIARIYKFFQLITGSKVELDVFHRYFMPAYFVLFSVISVFIIGRIYSGSFLALVMAFWFGVYIPSVIRSTGQEFMGENFALPLIFVHAAMYLAGLKTGKRIFLVVSSIFLAAGWVFWDMTNLYIYIFAVFLSLTENKSMNILIFAIPLAIVSVSDPYLRAHYSWLSVPVVYLAVISLYNWILSKTGFNIRKNGVFIKTLLFLLVFLCVSCTGYGSDYSHFWELLISKIKFFNVKPLDPAKLTFDIRVLWAPALHSATLYQVKKYFSCILITGMISIFLRFSRKNPLLSWEKYILICFFIFFVLYLFFVRVHVYTAFFAVMTILFLNKIEKVYVRILANIALVLLCAGEYDRTLSYQEYMGRGEDYRSLSSLIQWIQKNTKPDEPILASMNLAGPIINYADRPVILQPKYEKKNARGKYKKFIIALFSEIEKPFYNFTEEHGAKYFVYQKGTSWNNSIYSPVYFVGLSQNEVKNTLAAKFEGDFNSLDKFYPVFENNQYRIFKVVSNQKVAEAKQFFKKGDEYFIQSDYLKSESFYRRSLEIYPNYREARMKLGTVLWYLGRKNEAHREWNTGMFHRNESIN